MHFKKKDIQINLLKQSFETLTLFSELTED